MDGIVAIMGKDSAATILKLCENDENLVSARDPLTTVPVMMAPAGTARATNGDL